jgi:hypothetical protein
MMREEGGFVLRLLLRVSFNVCRIDVKSPTKTLSMAGMAVREATQASEGKLYIRQDIRCAWAREGYTHMFNRIHMVTALCFGHPPAQRLFWTRT